MNDEKSIISNDDFCSSIESNDFDVDEVLSYQSIEENDGARSKRNFNDCDDSVLIDEVKETDILCGRGGGINVHPGNRAFRNLVKTHQEIYLKAKKKMKPAIGASIVQILHSKGFRFLKKDFVTGAYYRISDSRARDKTCQALVSTYYTYALFQKVYFIWYLIYQRGKVLQILRRQIILIT